MRKAGGLPSSPSTVRYNIPCLGIVSPVEGCVSGHTSSEWNSQQAKLQMSKTLTVLSFSRFPWRNVSSFAVLSEQLPHIHEWPLLFFIGFVYSCNGEQVHRAPYTAILELELLLSLLPAWLQWEFLGLYNLTPSCWPESNASPLNIWPKIGQSPSPGSYCWNPESTHLLGSLLIRTERTPKNYGEWRRDMKRTLWVPKNALVIGSS